MEKRPVNYNPISNDSPAARTALHAARSMSAPARSCNLLSFNFLWGRPSHLPRLEEEGGLREGEGLSRRRTADRAGGRAQRETKASRASGSAEDAGRDPARGADPGEARAPAGSAGGAGGAAPSRGGGRARRGRRPRPLHPLPLPLQTRGALLPRGSRSPSWARGGRRGAIPEGIPPLPGPRCPRAHVSARPAPIPPAAQRVPAARRCLRGPLVSPAALHVPGGSPRPRPGASLGSGSCIRAQRAGRGRQAAPAAPGSGEWGDRGVPWGPEVPGRRRWGALGSGRRAALFAHALTFRVLLVYALPCSLGGRGGCAPGRPAEFPSAVVAPALPACLLTFPVAGLSSRACIHSPLPEPVATSIFRAGLPLPSGSKSTNSRHPCCG